MRAFVYVPVCVCVCCNRRGAIGKAEDEHAL